MVDLEQLLAEVPDHPPCGPNLEYDATFLELEKAAQGKPEQQFGDTLIPAEEPDWAGVRELAEGLLGRTKDLRVSVLLTRALIHELGVVGLEMGLRLMLQLLERYWDHIHPQVDSEEGNDPTMRLNVLAALADPNTVLRDVRSAWLLRSRSVGQLLVRDVEIALGRLPVPPAGAAATQDQVESMVRAGSAEDMAPINAVREAVKSLEGILRFLAEKVGEERAPDMRPLAEVLGSLEQVCDRVLGAAQEVGSQAGDAADSVLPPGASQQVSGDIRSRDEAMRVLDRVCEYLERNEPTNPAPLLIKRAKRLMAMSFMEIVGDLVPESLSQIETIAGIRQTK